MVPNKKEIPIMIDYAHSPESLQNILSAVKSYTRGRVISVFGCGGDRDKGKRPLMGEISGKIADFTFITTDNPRTEEPEEIVKEIEEGNNGIKIANDVISVIAGVAVSEVPGVASMAGGFAGGITEVLSGKKNLSKGIKVDADEKEVRIDVNIIVEYGSRIPDVAYEIQTRVKKSVENMTGLKVSEVNVHVQGVKTEKEVEEKEENEEVIEEQQ